MIRRLFAFSFRHFDGKAICFSRDVSQSYVSLWVCGIITAFCAPMAQRIEHRTSNPTVAGSSPAGRARIFWPERDLPSPAFLLSKAECILARSRAASKMINFPMPYNADAPCVISQRKRSFMSNFLRAACSCKTPPLLRYHQRYSAAISYVRLDRLSFRNYRFGFSDYVRTLRLIRPIVPAIASSMKSCNHTHASRCMIYP